MHTITNEKEALTIACFMEERGIELYQRALMVVNDDQVKKIITEVLMDEKEHLAQFRGFLEDIENTTEAISAEKHLFLKAYAGEFIFKGGLVEAQREGAFESAKSMVAFAIAQEEKAYEKYQAFAVLCENEGAKKAFLTIAQEERMHKKQLEKQQF